MKTVFVVIEAPSSDTNKHSDGGNMENVFQIYRCEYMYIYI